MLDPRETFSGVMGAFCCVYAGLPFEVVKVRLQTQGTKNAYAGVTDAFRRIATEEGALALWKGAVPALSSSIIENSVLFSANGFAKRAVLALHAKQRAAHEGHYTLTTLDEALMGAFAGCFSATVRCALFCWRCCGQVLTVLWTSCRPSRCPRTSSASCSSSAATWAKGVRTTGH
jgi:hypothetical protein